ncbi:roundabout homolog 2 isoform X27 [Narcine bancroftii]|uniref:roundabout homolog 2 isoform X27 n=1 Tax=Narcine bancroftii TaxID=1343680 RepID=UPI003831B84E
MDLPCVQDLTEKMLQLQSTTSTTFSTALPFSVREVTGLFEILHRRRLSRKEKFCIRNLLSYHYYTSHFDMDLPCVEDLAIKITQMHTTMVTSTTDSTTVPLILTDLPGLNKLYYSKRLSWKEQFCVRNLKDYNYYKADFEMDLPCIKNLTVKMLQLLPTTSTTVSSSPVSLSPSPGFWDLLRSRRLSWRERKCVHNLLEYRSYSRDLEMDLPCVPELTVKMLQLLPTTTSTVSSTVSLKLPTFSQSPGLVDLFHFGRFSRRENACIFNLLKYHSYHKSFEMDLLCVKDLVTKMLQLQTTTTTVSHTPPFSLSQSPGLKELLHNRRFSSRERNCVIPLYHYNHYSKIYEMDLPCVKDLAKKILWLHSTTTTTTASTTVRSSPFSLSQSPGSRLRQEDFPPRIAEHPSDLIVSKGEPATLNCKAEGRPSPTIEWYKDGERVETDRDDTRSHRMLLPSGSLFFLRIVHGRRSKPDEGSYVCVARNYLGEAVSHNASLEVALLRDDFRQNPADVVVAAGEPAIMECQPPRGHPEPTIFWKKDNNRISEHDERITMHGGKLMISNTKRSDAGKYICVGTNIVGEKDSESAELTVFERPTFMKRPINQIVLEDEAVEFRCQLQGDPQPIVRWRKDDTDVARGRYDIKDDNTLRIKRVSNSDEGTFTCVGENQVGMVEATATLTVRAAPQFVVRPRDQIVAQGRSATFPCETKGNPQPAIFWQKEGTQNLLFPNQPPQPSSRLAVSSKGDLTISNIQRSDAGYYICQALTVAGSILAKAQLEVTDALSDRPPPIIRQGPANQTLGLEGTALLKCQATGDPIPTVSWLKDGVSLLGKDPRMSLQELGSLQIRNVRVTDSGIYTCVATSSSGETSWSAFLEVRESGASTVNVKMDADALPGSPSKPQVADVTKSSVTLSWLPGKHAGSSPVTSYIIEAFSQSVSNSWQTVADRIKNNLFTVRGLRPNTVYLFMVRAVNVHGVSDPSQMTNPVRTQDISPPAQGVDHRQVQRELGDVIVRLHNPLVLTPSSIQITWMVERQSQFIQGYRVLFRQISGLPSPSSWQVLEVKAPTERSTVLTNLKKGVSYEMKVRPYFNEFQGIDSESKTARTNEEAPGAPPQSVTVLTVGNHNSTSISVSWDPPPTEQQNGIIQEYKIWCLGNATRFHINRTVDAAIRSVVIGGLLPGVQYRVQVAASTSAGVGVKSEPQPIVIGNRGDDIFVTGPGGNNSITEQITDVVKQPAFIAGIGGACWVILMGFSIWLYWRRKKRKGLSNYAVTFQRVDGGIMNNGSRPGLLNAGESSYPWLADSWPATSLPMNGSNNGPSDLGGVGNFSRTGQGDKSGTMLSDSAIYSSIDVTTKASFNSPGQITQATPYATTQILHSSSIQELAVDLPEPQWKTSIQQKSDPAGCGYSLPDQGKFNNALLIIPDYRLAEGLSNRMPHNHSEDFSTSSSHNSSERSLSGGKGGKKKKNKNSIKPQKSAGSNWSNVPLPPPPVQPLPGTELDHYIMDHHENGYDSDVWCPAPPVKSYLHQGMEDELQEDDRVPTPPVRGVASSPAISFGQQSTATLTPSPREELQPMLQAHLDEISRAYHFDISRQAWQMQGSSLPPQAPALPLGYISGTLISDIETDVPEEEEEEEDEEEEAMELARPLRGIGHTPGSSLDNLDSSVTGSMVNGWGSASEEERNVSSRRCSAASSSSDSIFTDGDFTQALATAADRAGYKMEGTSLMKTGKGYSSSQRLRPTSPFSTSSSLSTPQSQCQRSRPPKKHKLVSGRLEQPSALHRREAAVDDLPPPPDPPPFQGSKLHSGQGPRSTGMGDSSESQQLTCLEVDTNTVDHLIKTSLEGQMTQEDLRSKLQQKPTIGSEEVLIPYSKPNFPSPGHWSGQSSSGTASSKGSTGPRKGVPSRGVPTIACHQRNICDLPDVGYVGSCGQGQFLGDV